MSKRKYPEKPCTECPYIGNVPGWIGGHDDPREFIDLVNAEQEMPCHSKVDYGDDEWQMKQWSAPRCVGQLMMANRMCKRFRDPEIAEQQERVGKAPHTPLELVDLHRKGTIK